MTILLILIYLFRPAPWKLKFLAVLAERIMYSGGFFGFFFRCLEKCITKTESWIEAE